MKKLTLRTKVAIGLATVLGGIFFGRKSHAATIDRNARALLSGFLARLLGYDKALFLSPWQTSVPQVEGNHVLWPYNEFRHIQQAYVSVARGSGWTPPTLTSQAGTAYKPSLENANWMETRKIGPVVTVLESLLTHVSLSS